MENLYQEFRHILTALFTLRSNLTDVNLIIGILHLASTMTICYCYTILEIFEVKEAGNVVEISKIIIFALMRSVMLFSFFVSNLDYVYMMLIGFMSPLMWRKVASLFSIFFNRVLRSVKDRLIIQPQSREKFSRITKRGEKNDTGC